MATIDKVPRGGCLEGFYCYDEATVLVIVRTIYVSDVEGNSVIKVTEQQLKLQME